MRLSLARAAFFFLCLLLSAPLAAYADDSPPDTVTACSYTPFDIECNDVPTDAVPPGSLSPAEAKFLYDKDVLLRDGKFLTLTASFGGTPLTEGETAAIPINATGTLAWNYAEDSANPYHHILRQAPSIADVLGTADLTFDLYKGSFGDSSLVFSKTLTAIDTPSVEINFPEAGRYLLVYSATYPPDRYPPNMDPADYCTGDGDICPVFHFSLDDFRNFVTRGKTEEAGSETLGSYVPAAFGLIQFDVTAASTPPPPEASNVLFLPGIEGSRLYRPETDCRSGDCEEKLWEPIISFIGLLTGLGDEKIKDLFLDGNGESVRSDIYTKENDILDTALTTDYYKSFIAHMNALKAAGTLNDWKAVPYDWRLSLHDIVTNGSETDGHISYTTATDTPYIEQTLRELAASSKTGKVTIIAHSNGGLVVKELMEKLGNGETTNLIDNIIFVGVPQSGAPEAIGGLLYGDGESIPSPLPFVSVVKTSTAQDFARNAPMAYHLLPSKRYFDDTAADGRHPVSVFTGNAYAKEEGTYGQVIRNEGTLRNFLSASSGDNPLNQNLLIYGETVHAALDAWTPPAGVHLYEIAGWGADTAAGIDFYTSPNLFDVFDARSYRPIFIEDGDGVVPVPSALMTSADEASTQNYWLNLKDWNAIHPASAAVSHGNLLEANPLEDFIENILVGDTHTVPHYISSEAPPDEDLGKKLVFFLHSPLTLELYDASGNHTGQNTDGTFDENIQDATYGEFGDVKYLIAPEGPDYTLTMHGLDRGTFSLDMEEISNGVPGTPTTVANVPTTVHTTATLRIGNGINTASPLQVNEDGNGANELAITPRENDVVVYESPKVFGNGNTASEKTSSGSVTVTASTVPSISITTASSSIKAFPVETPASTTQPIAQPLVKSTKPLQPKSSATSTEEEDAGYATQTASAYEAISRLSWFAEFMNGFYAAFARAFGWLRNVL